MSPEPVTTDIRANEPSWGYDDLAFFAVLSTMSVLVCQVLLHLAVSALHIDPKSPLILLPTQLLVYACIFTVLFVLIKLQYGRQFWSSLAWTRSPVAPGAAFLLGLSCSFAVQIVGVVLHTPNTDTPIKKLLSNPGVLLSFGLLAVTIGPMIEELVFRGFIQPLLVRSLGRVIGISITAVVFGALHLAQNGFIWQMGLLITLAGVAFGWMREWTGSTRASTWMHAGFNSTIFLVLLQKQTLPHAL